MATEVTRLADRWAGLNREKLGQVFNREKLSNVVSREKLGSVKAAREQGLMRSEGKEYVVKDGDILLFRFNV